MKAKERVPLIVESDEAWTATMMSERAAMIDPPLMAIDVPSALEELEGHKDEIAVLVVSATLGKEMVMALVTAAMKLIPGLPVVLMTGDGDEEYSKEEIRAMVIQTVLRKPQTYEEMLKQLLGRAPVKSKRSRNDEDFAGIPAETFLAVEAADVDVYVKIRSNRYVKILTAGKPLGKDRLEKYLKKGIKEFFMQKSEKLSA